VFPSIAASKSANHEPSHWSHDHRTQVSVNNKARAEFSQSKYKTHKL